MNKITQKNRTSQHENTPLSRNVNTDAGYWQVVRYKWLRWKVNLQHSAPNVNKINSTVHLLEKLTFIWVVKEFLAVYEWQKFINMSTKANHWLYHKSNKSK
jgi:hypothetical protein